MLNSGNPPIVCLCGSTRFAEDYATAARDFTLDGWIVLTVGFFGAMEPDEPDEQVKMRLDVLHLHKIRMADRVHILNRDGYIGASTERELCFAILCGKTLTFEDAELGAEYLENNHDTIKQLVQAFALARLL